MIMNIAAILHSDSMAMYLKRKIRDLPGENYRNRQKLLANPVTVCTIDQLFTFVYRALGDRDLCSNFEVFQADHRMKYSLMIQEVLLRSYTV